jgi:hypothetical protein
MGNASYQGVATFNSAYPTDTAVCLQGEVALRCGFVVSRSDSESPRFALYDGGVQGEVYSLVARKKSDGIDANGYVDISTLTDSTNINLKMETILGDSSKTNGCLGGKSPNVFGRVTVGGSAYVTEVKLGQDWSPYSSTTAPMSMNLVLTTTSAIDGSYQFCVDTSTTEGVPKVIRAVAKVANKGVDSGLGDSYSTWLDSSCLLAPVGCEIPSFEMKPKFLWGTIVVDGDGNPSTPAIPLSNASIDINKNSQSVDGRWYGSFQTDALGRFAVSDIPQTGEFNVYVSPTPSCDISSPSCNTDTDINGSALSKNVTLSLAGSPKEMNVEVDRGNLRISALDPDGYKLSTVYSGAWARIIPSNDTCRVETVAENYTSECRVNNMSQAYYEKAPSIQIAKLATGTYDILMSATGFATSISTVSVSIDGVVSVVSGPLVSSGGNRFVQKVSNGNIKFRVNKGSDLTQVAPDSIGIRRYYSSNTQFLTSMFRGFIDEDGIGRWTAHVSGIYIFSFGATSGSADLDGYVSTDVIYEIQVVDGVASILHTCTVGSTRIPSCLGSPPAISEGSVVVALKKANFEGELCSALPVDSCAFPASFNPRITFNRIIGAPSTGSVQYSVKRSKFYFYIPEVASGINFDLYILAIRIYNGGSYTNQIRILKVLPSGVISYCGSNLFKVLDGGICLSSTSLDVDATSGRTILPSIRLKIGNVRGKVLEPGNSTTVVSQSRICFADVAKPQVTCNSQLDPFNSYTDQSGEFSVDLYPGTFRVQAFPSNTEGGAGSEYSEGTTTFTVGSDGVVVEPLVVRLSQPNIIGKVFAGSTAVAFSSVQTYKSSQSSSTGWVYAGFGINTKSTGRYYANLSEGTWKLVATPYGANASSYTAGSVIVVVDANGVIQTVNGSPYSGSVDISYGTPNLKLQLGNTGVSNLSIQLQKRNSSSGSYEYMNENGNYYMTSTQGAAIQLAEGRYQLTLYPYSTPGFVTTNYFFKADGSGVVCTVATKDSTTCLRTLTTGEILTVSLNGPNIKGVVRYGVGGAGSMSYLQVERFNTVNQYFEWSSDIQGTSANASGVFSMRLPVGFYRITANPASVNTGFTKGIEYVVVYEADNNGSTWCKPGGINPAPCVGPLKGPTDAFDVNLRPANVKGLVKFGNEVITNSSINVEKFVNERFEWVNESSSVQQGAFAVKLDGGVSPVKYRVTVNQPSPNPSKLGKRKITVWVGDFVAGGTDDDLCIQDELLLGSSIVQKCSNPITSGTQFEIQMSRGNVAGTVADPNGLAVGYSSIDVRVWNSSYWNWTDNYSNTSSDGSYALQLETGVYQVTARAPYGSSVFTSSAPQLLSVNSSGVWCRITSTENTACLENPTSLNISLRNPNLSGVLKNGSAPVSGVWMSVQKLQNSGSYSWWNWIDLSASTSYLGQFALNISDDGEYRLEISAPYGDSQLPRFYKYYTVNSGKICEGQGCTPSLSTLGLQQLSYPTPNFIGTVYSPTNQRVSNLGVDVEVWDSTSSYWKWANLYANVGSNGSFAMLLPSSARYRLRINPPWNGAGYPRFTQIVEVDSDGKVCGGQGCNGHVASLALDLKFPTANVVGKVVLKSDGLPSSISRWSWLYAYNSSTSTYEWANASAAGEYSMYLADGEWTMWFFPDYSRLSAQPIQVFAKVENGVLTSWRYGVDATSSNNCGGSTQCNIDVSFSYIPPNVRVKVTEGGEALVGAFVQLENLSTQATFDFTTDSNGLIEGLVPAGNYKVTALKVVGTTVTSVNGTIVVASAISTGTNSIVLSL